MTLLVAYFGIIKHLKVAYMTMKAEGPIAV
jgi:hypothetical protein